MKIIIIGGVAAGMSAASKIKRIDRSAEVVVYEKGKHLSYGACGLPYYISNDNDDWHKMIARTRDEFEAQGIITNLEHEVIKVFPKDKKVLVRNLTSGDMFIDNFDKLMIATGSSPIIPPIPGTWLNGVFTLKSLEDGILIKELSCNSSIKDVVVVGGGYIGIEVVEAMSKLNKNVRCIEASENILSSFDSEISKIAAQEIVNNGVKLHTSEKLEAILGSDRVEGIKTNKGSYKADMVILAIGVKPNTAFLKDSGIRMAKNGAIIIDREMRTRSRYLGSWRLC